MSARVYIAVQNPQEGNYFHWALYVKGSENHVYEVIDQHPQFSYSYSNANPASTGCHRENVLVGYISESDIAKINKLMPKMAIDNSNPGWTCQDWVIEALEELCGEYILDEDDEDFAQGVGKAKQKYFGPQWGRNLYCVQSLPGIFVGEN